MRCGQLCHMLVQHHDELVQPGAQDGVKCDVALLADVTFDRELPLGEVRSGRRIERRALPKVIGDLLALFCNSAPGDCGANVALRLDDVFAGGCQARAPRLALLQIACWDMLQGQAIRTIKL